MGIILVIALCLLFGYLLYRPFFELKYFSPAVLQKDGESALLGEYPLTLVDGDQRQIYVRLTADGNATAYTLLDDEIVTPNRTWCMLNGHNLYFKRDGKKIFVRWESDLSPK